jgi:hypothetical protein
MTDADRTREDALFELVLFLVASARLTLDETTTYGSFRLIDAASRLLQAAGADWGMDLEGLLAEAQARIDRDKLLWLQGPDPYKQFLSELVVQLTEEATRRNLEAPAA